MSKLKTNVYYVESVGGAVIEEENEMNVFVITFSWCLS